VNALDPPYDARDPGGMAARIEGIPGQVEAAVERLAREPWPAPVGGPALLAVGGLGGSAIAADLTAALWSDRLPRPMLVVRDYHWPACVDASGLALLCSYSGNTEETLALYREAGARGVPRLALTTGGTLADACRRDGVAFRTVPGGSPPRAALFSAWVPLSGLLAAIGWVEDPAAAWRETARHLRARDAELRPAVPARANAAKQLAAALQGRFVIVYSASERLGPVATRWRQQLNENAKMLGHSAVVPELNHNEIVGWERSGPVHPHAAIVVLSDEEDDPAVARRLAITVEIATRQGAAVHHVASNGTGRLARLASLVQFGDYLSLYLALLDGVDPTPIASIDELKRRLAESGARRGD
jgi:glucose/mannose-6-phosphate isomerase